MQKDSYETYDCQGMELKICDEAMKLDFLINVPVMKGHCQTKITCALKNMKGLDPKSPKNAGSTLWGSTNLLPIWQQGSIRILLW